MRWKLTILTISTIALAALSFYCVYGDGIFKMAALFRPKSDWPGSLSGASDKNQETAYLFPVTEPNYLPVRNQNLSEPNLVAKSFLLYDKQNGRIIFSKNAFQLLPIASLTKLMTAVLSVENLPPKTVVTIDEESYRVNDEASDFYLGEQLYYEDLLGAMLVKSSNDAAFALAEAVETRVGGRFFYLMNSQARELGMFNSVFLDPAGLSDDAYSTAEDLLKLVRYSEKYPLIWEFLDSATLNIVSADGRYAHNFSNTNRLLGQWPEIIGGKTGYTEGALGCMILEARVREGKSALLAIVLGSTNRFEDVKNLIEWGKTAFRWE